jgi:hypothetical protein
MKSTVLLFLLFTLFVSGNTSGGDEAGVYIGSYAIPSATAATDGMSPRNIALSNDGSKVYLDGEEDGLLQIIDISNLVAPTLLGSYTNPAVDPGSVMSITLSSDDSKAYITHRCFP